MTEILQQWTEGLARDVREFDNLGTKVSEWDQSIVEFGDKILQLETDTGKLEKQSQEVDAKLESIDQQQRELKELLDSIDKEVDQSFVSQSMQMNPQDLERAHTYGLASNLNQQLNQMQMQIKKMIEKMNQSFDKAHSSSTSENPLSTVVKILNVHLLSLQWVDENSTSLQTSIESAHNAILRTQHDMVTRR